MLNEQTGITPNSFKYECTHGSDNLHLLMKIKLIMVFKLILLECHRKPNSHFSPQKPNFETLFQIFTLR